ncbi:MAG: HTH-type transcriptional regulator [Caulobacter sp.]|jgi:DNA-binding transcriptional ArsR family regulator|nr:HTH-type transcriptional regulator [Caulobacter sp.]
MSPEVAFDHTLTALADPTRRAILARLTLGEARVTDLARPFDLSLNAVSKHIRMLERGGLVKRRRAGREHILTLDPAPLDATADWIAAQKAAWSARLQLLDDILQEEDKRCPTSSN